MSETALYGPLQDWLKEQGYEVRDEWKNVGFYKCHIDVMGIKNSGNVFYDDIEIVAIEAKLSGSFTSLGQADNYKDFSHKVYFATAKKEISDQLKEDVLDKRLGLLQVDQGTGKVNKIFDAVPARPRSEAQTTFLLHRLGVVRCIFCRCYFKKSDDMTELKRAQPFNKKKTIIRLWLCKECLEFLKLDKVYLQKQDFKNAELRIEKKITRLDNQCQWEEKQFKKERERHRKWFGDHNKRINALRKAR